MVENELFSSSCCIRVLVRLSASVTLLEALSKESSLLVMKDQRCQSKARSNVRSHNLKAKQITFCRLVALVRIVPYLLLPEKKTATLYRALLALQSASLIQSRLSWNWPAVCIDRSCLVGMTGRYLENA